MDGGRRKPGTSGVELVENVMAPELFADEVSYYGLGNGMVALTLTSLRWANDGSESRPMAVVTGRIKLPVAAARVLATDLHNFLEQHGVKAISEEERRLLQ